MFRYVIYGLVGTQIFLMGLLTIEAAALREKYIALNEAYGPAVAAGEEAALVTGQESRGAVKDGCEQFVWPDLPSRCLVRVSAATQAGS